MENAKALTAAIIVNFDGIVCLLGELAQRIAEPMRANPPHGALFHRQRPAGRHCSFDARKAAMSRHRIGDGLIRRGCDASCRRALLRMDGGKCHSINDLGDLLLS